MLASVPLVLAALLAPAHAAPIASTYDEATCASVRGEDPDGWARAAIGEDAPAPLPPSNDCAIVVPAPIAADCNDPLASRLVGRMTGEMIGTCAMPRITGSRNGLRPAHSDAERRVQRLLVEVAAGDSALPLAPPSPDRDAQPVLLASRPALPSPLFTGRLHFPAPPSLCSISGDTLLRPPRA